MKIISYNINGIRAALSKGLFDWIKCTDAEIICFQELKADLSVLKELSFDKIGYHTYWFPAVKKGYSGVGILTKQQPLHIIKGIGIEKYDVEGRCIQLDFENFSIINVYMPSGNNDVERQLMKINWLEDFQNYIQNKKNTKPLIISGDYNLCHRDIDIHNPSVRKNRPGCSPEERNWMNNLLNQGFIDSFRYLNPEPHHYTWWSYMSNSRKKNLGWRIDYHLVESSLKSKINRSVMLSEAKHSDHCPILLDISL